MSEFLQSEHTLKVFDFELAKLRHRLIKMGTLVQQEIELSLTTLFENNAKLAVIVADIEKQVDKLDIKIDKQCMKIFALHQPVAMDLRLVLSSVSINDYFELIGDMASDIAKKVSQVQIDTELLNKTKIRESGELISAGFAKIMDSLMLLDENYSKEIIDQEEKIKTLHDETVNILKVNMKESAENIDLGCFLIDVSKNLIFMANQIRTIAQELVFLFEAKIVKHQQNMNKESKPEDLINDDMV
jgi:phosphate transport system protein